MMPSKLKTQIKTAIAFLIITIIIISADVVSAQKARSMWIWNSANQVNNIINNFGNYRKDFFKFCMSPHNNPANKISLVFLSCRDAVYSNSDNLRNFIAEAVDSGITIEYLDGDPTWATYNQLDGIERINKVIEFNKKTLSEKEKIKGIQFDVEPYLITQARGYKPPFWDTDKMTVWESYVNYSDTCQSIIDTSGTNLYFGIAIPRWYENHVGVNELKRLQSKVDYVAIMDYNENAGVIINDAANEIQNATELNKKVWIGVETKQVSPETVSFYEEGNAFMETQLDSVFSVYKNVDAFLGFAIHAYNYYKSLRNEPVSVKKNENSDNQSFVLNQNYPNPFNSTTNFSFYLSRAGYVSLTIYNLLGQEQSVILDNILKEGWHELSYTSDKLASGIYYYELKADELTLRKKMILLK